MDVKVSSAIIFLWLTVPTYFVVTEKVCTYTRQENTNGVNGQFQGVMTNIGECEAACTPVDTCLAAYFDPPVCYFSSNGNTESKQKAIFSTKKCTELTTTGTSTAEATTTNEPETTTTEPTTAATTTSEPTTAETTTSEPTTAETTNAQPTTAEPTTAETTTSEPTTAETTTAEPTTITEPSSINPVNTQSSTAELKTQPSSLGVCQMVRTDGSTGGDEYFVKLTVNGELCEVICSIVDKCRSVTYYNNVCRFYTDVTSTQTILGSYHSTKMKCIDGYDCCWNNKSSTSGGNNHAFEYKNTADSCEALCSKFLRCTSINWFNGECTIYINSPDSSPRPNSFYSKKTCTKGGDLGSYTFNTICTSRNSGRKMTTTQIFIILVICYFYIFH